jgi:hypothetical protein
MYWFVSPVSQTQPRHLLSACSTVYFLLLFAVRSTQTQQTLQYIWHIAQTHAGSGKDGGGAVTYQNERRPEACPRPETGLVRLAGCKKGGTERDPETDRQRPIHSSLSLSLYVSFAVGHNSMAFMISLNIKREQKPTGGLYPHLLS